jgi:glycosyltransferase involved in cell wall biosynthesis
MLPRVSVVIPVYNATQWLRDTISSIGSQAYPKDLLEIVIVDDGSTDGSAEIASSCLNDTGIDHTIIRTTNGGPSRARNLGWTGSRGDWIQFLDADDLIAPHKIELQARAAVLGDPAVAVVHSGWQTLEMPHREWMPTGSVKEPVVREDVQASLIAAEGFIHTGSGLFRRSSLEAVGGFDERHWLIEDVDLLLRIAMARGRFLFVRGGAVFFYRRYGTASLSQRDPAFFHEGCIRNAMMVEQHWQAAGELTTGRARQLAEIYYNSLRFFAVRNRTRFEELAEHIEALLPGFVPKEPGRFRIAGMLIGFRRAALLSVAYRRLRVLAGTGQW